MPDPATNHAPAIARAIAPPNASSDASMVSGKTILVVDDDPLNRYLLTEALADDHHIIEAADGLQALAQVSRDMPDLILLDIDMPGMDGLATCREIRALPGGRLVPVMMVTGLHDTGSVDAAFDCGATDFLAKPLNWSLLRQRVRFLLRNAEITRGLDRHKQILEQMQAITRIGYWEWDLRSGAVEISPSTRGLIRGIPSHVRPTDHLQDHAPAGLRTVHEGLEAIRGAIARGDTNVTAEYDVRDTNNGVTRLLTQFRVQYENGEAIHVLGTSQDISERYLNEERFTAIFNNSPVGLFEGDFSALYEFGDAMRPQLEGSDPASWREQVWPRLDQSLLPIILRENEIAHEILTITLGPRYRQQALESVYDVLKSYWAGQPRVTVQRELIMHDGTSRHVVYHIPHSQTAHGRRHVVASITDITPIVEHENQLRRADTIIENSNDGIMLLDSDGRIVSVNPAFVRISGYSAREMLGQHAAKLFADADSSLLELGAQQIEAQLQQHGYYRCESLFTRRDRTPIALSLSMSLVRGNPGGYVIVITDITDLIESERRLFRLAHFDTLTQLPNRLSLQERLEAEFSRDSGPAPQMTLLYIDLDGFKLVNDSLGHSTGDILLSEVAQRLRLASNRESDVLARIGGDEFALLLLGSPDHDAITAQATRLLAALGQPFHVQDRAIFIGASIGACSYPDGANNAGDMLRNADTAMYEAKRRGRGQLCFYSQALTLESARRLAIENELRTGIADNELFLVYQPKYGARSGQLIGAEALVRWRSPSRGVVEPLAFIGIAEETGLIIALGEWVIRESCRQIAQWRDQHGLSVAVAINISALHLRQHSLAHVLREAIARYAIDPRLLEIEITEDCLDFRDDNEVPYAVLTSLAELGLSIAIDDFGTGYSSLSQLKKMPISTLKIDRSFVCDIATCDSDYAIITAIVRMANTLRLSIVAEGVETEEQAARLRTMGCDVLQGYLFAQPLAPDVFLERALHTR